MTEQREYNLCPGCGKASTAPYRGGWKHGGISWHKGCLGRPSLLSKEGLAYALRHDVKTKADELEVLANYERLKRHSDA